MPRRKQNVDAFGKSWSPIDLPNLEKAVKLYERLNYLQDHFAGSLSGANKIMAQINEQAEIKEELQKLGIKHNEEELKQVIKLIQQRQNENRAIQNKPQGSTYNILTGGERSHLYGDVYKTNQYNGVSRPQAYNGTLTMNNWGQFYQGVRQSNFQQAQYNRALQNEIKALKDRGSIMSEKSLKTFAEKNIANGKMTKETSDILQQSGKDFSLGASLLNVAANTFSKAVSVFSELFFGGLKRQANVYENTFTNISVRNGTTKDQYFGAQLGTKNLLDSMGLGNNVRVSDIQTMWNTLASQGIKVDLDSEKTLTRAIETAVTSTVVPYLNASDEYFQQLVDQQPSLMKYVRGIGAATQEVSGNSVFVNKYLQDMIDNLSPMAALAENQLGVQYAQMSGAYESLRAQGLSDATIGEMYKSASQVYRDPLAALRSGNLDTQLAVVNGIVNGIDFRDASQVNNEYMRAANFVSNLTPEGKMSPIYAGITNTSLSTMGKVELNERNLSIEQAIADGIETAEKTPSQADKKTEDFQNDVNQTLKTLQSTELENLSTWLAKIYESLGYWGDILAVLLKGIGAVIGAKIIGGIGKKILGISGGKGLVAGLKNLGGGLATSTTASVGAGLAVAGGALAGGAMVAKGGMDIYNDLSSGEGWTGKTTASAVGAAGGAIGAGALLAFGASNPVGWVALAVGGAALLGRSLYEAANNYEKAGKKIEKEFNEVALRLDQEQIEREENLLSIKDNLQQTSDVEKARNDLIELGVLSAEDEKKWRDMSTEELKKNKDALIALTDQYIKSTKDFNNAEQELLETIKTDQVTNANEAAKSIKEWFEKDYKGDKGNTTENNEIAKALINNMATELNKKGRSNWSDDEKKFMERYEKNSRDGKWTYGDMKWVLEGGGSWWGISNAIMDNTTDLLTNTGFALYANNRGKSIKGFNALDPNLVPYAAAITQATSKAEAEEAVKKAKEAGMKYSDWSKYIGDSLTKWGIPSFRSGLSYVPYDDYVANLHEGEAVITAATANELRNLITTYRESQQTNVNLDTAIQNQTTVLVNKMDQMIQTIESINSPFSTTKSNNTLFANMKYMRSTKSFNQKTE